MKIRNVRNYCSHYFYCISCGQRNIPVMRSRGDRRERQHRKVLYCPWCKHVVNMIECYDDQDVYEFKQNFEKGKYLEEAKESLKYTEEKAL